MGEIERIREMSFPDFFFLKVLPSQHKAVAQVFLSYNLVFGKFFGRALEEDFTFEQQVGPVGDAQCFLYVVVCNQDTDILVFQSPHNVLDVFYGNRVNSGKRFVKHDEFRVDGQAAGNFRSSAFASLKLVAQILPYLL